MKLSFIIPIYNVERWLKACVDSILYSNLNKDEYEILLVNDGSTDSSPEIAQKYALEYTNIIYLTQENQGQSVARNYGIRECHGEYIWFVDSDDMLEPDLFNIISMLNELGAIDILGVHLKQVSEEGVFIEERNTQPSVPHYKKMTGKDAIMYGYNPSSVCALITKKSLFIENSLAFYPGISHQDVELSYKMMAYAQNVIFTDFIPYIYILHLGSTSKAIIPEKKIKYVSDDITIVKSFMKLAHEFDRCDIELSKVIRKRCQNILFGLVYSLYSNKKEWKPIGVNSAVVEKMKREGLYPLTGPFDNWKKTLISKLLNIEFFIN